MGWGRRNKRRKRSNPKAPASRKNFDTLVQKAFATMDPQMKERWDTSKTTRQNYAAMGLAFACKN